jgi:excisionase family DNA binding protein
MSAPVTLTVAQVAVLLGVSRSAVYDAVRRGELRNVGLGRAVRIPRIDLEARIGGPVRTPEPEVIAEGTFL